MAPGDDIVPAVSNTLAGHTAPVAVTRHHVLLIPDRIQFLSGITQLGGFFHLDAAARRRAMACNGARNQVGFARYVENRWWARYGHAP
ncbi:hypothetical protein B0I32_14121 [Nonomuraea fuscirosea]|uniref:Uncharacterized protein n=1 Tax=Nonomuraea fuscirosea TaxID=1291556 RepID=A0A2T0LVV1_9ACTN|nr:hypothetical protein B0I32_14121 [Nonomuraea fuscirosea]